MSKTLRVLLPVLLATLLLVTAAYAVNQMPLVERPAPQYGPPGVRVVTVNTGVITQDTNFANVNGQGYSTLDLFYRIDQTVVAGAPNTTSLKLEVSPDAINWYASLNLPTVLTANVADANGYVSVPLAGYQFRIVADVDNTNPITPVLKAVMH